MRELFNHHNEPIAKLSPVIDGDGEYVVYVIYNNDVKLKNVVVPVDEFKD